MDFFAAQEHARRRTALLLAYFLAATTAIVAGVYLAITLALAFGTRKGAQMHSLWNPELFTWVALGTLGVILLGSLYKVAILSMGGGAAVTEMLGGRRVEPTTEDKEERRLLNVVAEMAIASGVPTPPVYVLDTEYAINAFAAGLSHDEAVVAVTRGTLQRLSRDELQGVVAHEFSHILNGDMRLNVRLLGLLHGILLIALLGRLILRGSSHTRSKNSGVGVLVGAGLLVVGYVGVLFARLIQAAVSRQREFLADASAVQFTRATGGIASALKKIAGMSGGAELNHGRAEEVNHMLFGEGVASFTSLLASHPPVEERIRRLDPHFDVKRWQAEREAIIEERIAEISPTRPREPGPLPALAPTQSPASITTPAQVARSIGTLDDAHIAYARQLLATVPASIRSRLKEPEGARAILYTLLLGTRPELRETQLHLIAERDGESVADWCREHGEWLAGSGARVRLPVLDQVIATLRGTPLQGRMALVETAHTLARSDGITSLFEYALIGILRERLLNGDARRAQSHVIEVPSLRRASSLAFTLLARVGHAREGKARIAYAAAISASGLPDLPGMSTPEVSGLAAFDAALTQLAGSPLKFRRNFLTGCSAAVTRDGVISIEEGELLRLIAERLHLPLPPLLPGQPFHAHGG